jgi:hypothetical protein
MVERQISDRCGPPRSPSGIVSISVRSAARAAPVEHRSNLIVVEPERDHVDLDREPAAARAASIPRSATLEIADAGDVAEAIGVERVEADIDAAMPAVASIGACSASRMPLVVSVNSSRPPPIIAPSRASRASSIAAPHQRLAAGQADAADAARDEAFGDAPFPRC